MIITMFDLKKRGFFKDRFESIQATSCKSVLVMLNKRKPENWITKCEENNLAVEVKAKLNISDNDNLSTIRPLVYRELANHMAFIAKNSLNESLERVFIVRIKIVAKKLTVNAVTDGKDIAKLNSMSTQKFIAEHLKRTVQTQEVITSK